MPERTTNREVLGDEAQAGADAVKAQREPTAFDDAYTDLFHVLTDMRLFGRREALESHAWCDKKLATLEHRHREAAHALATPLRSDVTRLEGERDALRTALKCIVFDCENALKDGGYNGVMEVIHDSARAVLAKGEVRT